MAFGDSVAADLAAVNAAIHALTVGGMQSYSLAGNQFNKLQLGTLYAMRKDLEQRSLEDTRVRPSVSYARMRGNF